MLNNFNAKSLSALVFILLAGCGGGGGGGSDGISQSSGGQIATTTSSSTSAQPALATAVSITDGTTLGQAQWSEGDTSTGGQGQTVSGLGCTAARTSYSYTHLTIFQNGRQLAVPANIGSVSPSMANPSGCVYPVHTDDSSGKIRINSAAVTPYTLGQFFAIWGQPLSSSNIAGLSGTVTIYLNDNGTLTKYTGDPATIQLLPQRQIILMVGSIVTQIPAYTWKNPLALSGTATVLNPGPAGTLGTIFWTNGNTVNGGTGAAIGNATCSANMVEDYHVHVHLAIFRDGQQLAIPQEIGLLNNCIYEVHNHDLTGVIHVEGPAYKRHTLGEFFGIWGQPLTLANIAGITAQPVAIYIEDNGDIRQFTGDPTTIELVSHRSIIIQIGTPLGQLPTYRWDNFGTY